MAKLIKLDETKTGETMFAYNKNIPLWETIKEVEKDTNILKLEIIIDNDQQPIGYLKIKPNLQIKKNNEIIITENPTTVYTKDIETNQPEMSNKELPIAQKENLPLEKLDEQLKENLKNIEIQEFNKTRNKNSFTEDKEKLFNPFALPKPTVAIQQNTEENWDEEITSTAAYLTVTQNEKPSKDQAPTTAEEREEDDNTRIFCFVTIEYSDDDFFNDFKIFGPIDYIYTTLDKSQKIKLGYIRYLEARDAEKAIQNAKYHYKAKLALPQRKYNNTKIQKETYHTECQRYTTTRYFNIHKEICAKQQIKINEPGNHTQQTQPEDEKNDPGQFEQFDKTKIKNSREIEPNFIYTPTISYTKPIRKEIVLPNIDYNSGKLIGEAKRIILDYKTPVIIDENASRTKDPFNGILWDNAKFIDAAEPMSITQTKLNTLTDEEIANLISYLELMRNHRDKVEPTENLISIEPEDQLKE